MQEGKSSNVKYKLLIEMRKKKIKKFVVVNHKIYISKYLVEFANWL
jgi:hypothetical protein